MKTTIHTDPTPAITDTHRADVLIVTVTKVESVAVIDVFRQATGTKPKLIPIGDRNYNDLGIVNGAHVFMAISEMGSGGIGGSQEAVRKGIEALGPHAVIMVGIAFGIDEKKQAIGDILVSKQILLYELQRVGKDQTLSRGDKVHASARLINRIANADLSWDEAKSKVNFGLILSGDKLVDNVDYRNRLIQFAEEAIGGEMEGAGLYVACQEKKVDWILVKAICDWADGNKGDDKVDRQKLAAHNAASFVLHVLEIAPFKSADAAKESIFRGQTIQLEKLTISQIESKTERERSFSELNQTVIGQGDRTVEMVAGLVKTIERTQPSASQNYPKGLVDSAIHKQLTVLQRARFYGGFSPVDYSLGLGDKIRSGELAGGSDNVRSSALAWCARVLTTTEHKGKCDEFLDLARQLGNGEEVTIAEAFRTAANSQVDKALGELSKLSSPTARSAAVLIVFKHQDATVAIEWLSKSGLTHADLDADGKFILTAKLLTLGHWDAAFEGAVAFNDGDYQRAPPLLHLSAMSHVAQVIPVELRPVVLEQVPFEVDTFPLASNESSLRLRRSAEELFSKCALAARELDCEQAANISDDYALWLKIRDPDRRGLGLEVLQSSMRNPEHSLRRLHFATKFGLKLDIEAVEREIDRKTALSGGSSSDAALARFSLALIQKDAAAVADYIGRHRVQLYQHIAKQIVQKVEIEALARSGFHERAEERLTELINGGLSEDEQRQLRRIIETSKGSDPKAALKKEFEISSRLSDLQHLVFYLEEQGDWPQVCDFGSILFKRTQSIFDAERVARALDRTKRHGELAVLLRAYPEFLDQSDQLRIQWAWCLYREGALADSSITLKKLRTKRDHPSDRALLINLAIASGDWESLLSFVEEEWVNRNERDAEDLLRTAQLAHHVGSARAKDLMYAVAGVGADNAKILIGAYGLATSAGLDIDADASQWLNRAAELSDESGPIQRISLREILDGQPEWNILVNDTWDRLNQGVAPIFVAAQLLRRSLVDMVLRPSLANPSEADPRRRSIVPAYSGGRPPIHIDGQIIALDATALLTLGTLNLLKALHEVFRLIVIPHSTLGWLFEERRKISFHQPSRVKNAHELRQLLATGALKEFSGRASIDADLAAEIGEDLASLIAEAQISANSDVDPKQKFVIRSSPVHRVTSLMEEEADLSAYYSCLCSCMAIVNKLKQKGQLTVVEEERARSYLKLHESDWPRQPELPDGAVLLLDDVAVSHLQHIRLLSKLKPAGLEAYVSASEIEDVNALINHEHVAEQVSTVVESIRSFLAEGIQAGNVKLAPLPIIEETAKSVLLNHPSMSIFRLTKEVDAIIVDDRSLNEKWSLVTEAGQIPIATTLDLLDVFCSKSAITLSQAFECKTRLRRACYIFVPVTPQELQQYLSDAQVVDNRLVETAELKALRENLLRIQMSFFFQNPKDTPWLDGIMRTVMHTLKDQWTAEINATTAVARSDWLLTLFDLRGWAQFFSQDGGLGIVEVGYGTQVLHLILAASNMPQEIRGRYCEWIEVSLLTTLQDEDPALYSRLIERIQEFIAKTVLSVDQQ